MHARAGARDDGRDSMEWRGTVEGTGEKKPYERRRTEKGKLVFLFSFGEGRRPRRRRAATYGFVRRGGRYVRVRARAHRDAIKIATAVTHATRTII